MPIPGAQVPPYIRKQAISDLRDRAILDHAYRKHKTREKLLTTGAQNAWANSEMSWEEQTGPHMETYPNSALGTLDFDIFDKMMMHFMGSVRGMTYRRYGRRPEHECGDMGNSIKLRKNRRVIKNSTPSCLVCPQIRANHTYRDGADGRNTAECVEVDYGLKLAGKVGAMILRIS